MESVFISVGQHLKVKREMSTMVNWKCRNCTTPWQWQSWFRSVTQVCVSVPVAVQWVLVRVCEYVCIYMPVKVLILSKRFVFFLIILTWGVRFKHLFLYLTFVAFVVLQLTNGEKFCFFFNKIKCSFFLKCRWKSINLCPIFLHWRLLKDSKLPCLTAWSRDKYSGKHNYLSTIYNSALGASGWNNSLQWTISDTLCRRRLSSSPLALSAEQEGLMAQFWDGSQALGAFL